MHSRTLHPDGTLCVRLRVIRGVSREVECASAVTTLRCPKSVYTVPTDYRTSLDAPKGYCSYTYKRTGIHDVGSLPARSSIEAAGRDLKP